ASPGGLNEDDPQLYWTAAALDLNQWAFAGKWKDEDQVATSLDAGASISFRFHARDLHLVLGPGPDGKPVRFRVLVDGHATATNHSVVYFWLSRGAAAPGV